MRVLAWLAGSGYTGELRYAPGLSEAISLAYILQIVSRRFLHLVGQVDFWREVDVELSARRLFAAVEVLDCLQVYFEIVLVVLSNIF